jgi:tetratricopeptide (TPR) repeat protein
VLQNYLGQCLLAEGKTTQAKSAFLAAKAADPNVRGVDLSLAEIDISQGNVQGARNKLLQLTDVNGDVSARLALASIEQSAGNGELAASHYRAVLQQDANNLIALNNLAYLLAEAEGGTNEALQYARRAKDLAPNDPLITDTLAWVFIQKKMPKLAIEQLEAAVSKQPSIAPIYYHLAVAYQMAGDKSRARDRVQTALKLDPKMSEALVFLRYLDEPARK